MIKVEELKIPNYVYDEEFDVKVRPYLTIDDIIEIGEMMLGCEDSVTQNLVMELNILKKCTDIPEEYLHILTEEEATEDKEDKFLGFDLICLSGLGDAVINKIINLDSLLEYVESKQNIQNVLCTFIRETLSPSVQSATKVLEKWEKKMPKGKQWNDIITTLPDSFKDILTTIKEDGNAEIINNAMKMNSVVKEDAPNS